jgi:hypothetical protein
LTVSAKLLVDSNSGEMEGPQGQPSVEPGLPER